MPDFDAIVVGAGVAGLAAFAALDRAGLRVTCVEARDRIGGRVHTVRDPALAIPIELGAEFVHGRPPELWRIIREGALAVYDCQDSSLHIQNGEIQSPADAWEAAGPVMAAMMKAAASGPDRSFAAFLDEHDFPEAAKALSTNFIEGFNAAREEIVGIASLAADKATADTVGGDRSFRFFSGYDSVPQWLFSGVRQGDAKLQLGTIVRAIHWRPGEVTIETVAANTSAVRRLTCRRAILTMPLGVLTDLAAIDWDPLPQTNIDAAKALAFGQVMRVILRFAEPFWEQMELFRDVGFLISDEIEFPAWWTALGARVPILTAWSAGPHPDTLLGLGAEQIAARALEALSRMTRTPLDVIRRQYVASYFHDWSQDPFARGAYSYVPVDAMKAREQLAAPVARTIYFAGEATNCEGQSATVHGAIAEGRRVARTIVEDER